MKFYALVLWRLRGEIPKRLQLVYLGNGEILAYEPDEHDLLAVERKVKALWAAIELAATTGDWRPRPSRLCDWCDHRALCPAWGGTPPPLPDDAASRAHRPGTERSRRSHRGRRLTGDRTDRTMAGFRWVSDAWNRTDRTMADSGGFLTRGTAGIGPWRSW